jgi:LysR family transcriptional regulator, glycine cleavage system transcriptional activator
LPSRTYCTYIPDEKANDDLVLMFRAWLESEGAR